MKTSTRLALGWLLSLWVGTTATADDPPRFDASVAPILARRCLDCHSGGDPKGKLDLSARARAMLGGENGDAIVPGKPDESLLWEQVESGEMPPKAPLSSEEKAVLRRWIADGATWGTDPIDPYQVSTSRRAGRDWWSLQPVRRTLPPEVSRQGWDRSPIDRFVLRKLEAEGLSPRAEADRRTLIRRLRFDLTGLPPTPEEVDAFLADDSPDAYEKLVDRLLASPDYGVRWARWWLDLARFGESNGFEFDEIRPNAWRYRDWVVDALNRDLPYDEFARLQLAGDALRPDDPTAIEATGFLVANAYDSVGQSQISEVMKANVRADELEDFVGTVAQTFLGLTVHCARCHDHKFDPIRQAEYYKIASALDGVRHGERDLSSIDPGSVDSNRRIATLTAKIHEIEAPAREQILARRQAKPETAPSPRVAWDFDRGLEDRVGSFKATLRGGASIGPEGLRVDGQAGYAETAPLAFGLKAKTIEAWVRLDNLEQRGGGVIGLQSPDGRVFDAIVFGELEPGRWMVGSEGFVRTKGVAGPAETEAAKRPVHVAITYAGDGTIRLYRDGQPYGNSYVSSGPMTLTSGQWQVIFGLRHSPVGGNKMLAGTIVRARLYDRALDPSEVAASAGTFSDFVSPDAIAEALPPEGVQERSELLGEVAEVRAEMANRARKAYVVKPRESGSMRVQIRGNPAQPGDVVAPGGIVALASTSADFGLAPDAPEAARREKLARWITDSNNPLFTRVVVNRLWQMHFGSGLVETPSDLGFNGGAPANPELLDWLASELVNRGWSLKAMHRLIVTSASYRQSSKLDPSAMKRDAGDRFLWRKAPTRLEAEMVRDAMFAISGRLNPKLGGPSYFDQTVTRATGTTSILYTEADPSKPGLDRRTLYRAWVRGGRSGLLNAFDCPDPSTTAPKRAVTTTPLQALALMNNALVLHLSDAFAARLAREAGGDPGSQVDLAYRLSFGRKPEAGERERAVRLVEKFGASTLARVLFNSNEFLYVD
jgi:Protein of unknown function (DUF1553)/Protein of unknown function (DUF1549)/Concanavalin A-like lectin/glucanases superfamily/Planctomycete cytochrome C